MDKTSALYQTYLRILHEELIPAMGCTEPIAIAYAAAKAREVLGRLPGKVWLGVSNNIIKNVKSVIVPNTGGMKGIEAAAAAGIVGGQAGRALEVISEVTEEQKAEMRRFLAVTPIQVEAVDYGQIFDITVRLAAGEETAAVRIAQYHTNIVHRGGDRRRPHRPVPHQHRPHRKERPGPAGCSRGRERGRLRPRGRRPRRGRPGRPGPFDHRGHPGLCRHLQPRGHPPGAGHPDPVQHPHLGGGAAGGLRCQHRLHHAQVLRRRRPQPGHRQGGRRLRRPDERLRAAGGHQLGQRQPGHHGVGAGDRVRQGPGRPQGPAVPGPGGTTRPSPTPWSTRWPSSRASSATGPSPAAPPRSPPAWRPASWATTCT